MRDAKRLDFPGIGPPNFLVHFCMAACASFPFFPHGRQISQERHPIMRHLMCYHEPPVAWATWRASFTWVRGSQRHPGCFLSGSHLSKGEERCSQGKAPKNRKEKNVNTTGRAVLLRPPPKPFLGEAIFRKTVPWPLHGTWEKGKGRWNLTQTSAS